MATVLFDTKAAIRTLIRGKATQEQQRGAAAMMVLMKQRGRWTEAELDDLALDASRLICVHAHMGTGRPDPETKPPPNPAPPPKQGDERPPASPPGQYKGGTC